MATTGAASPIFVSGETLQSILTHSSVMNHLQASLPQASSTLHTPLRHTHAVSPTSSLLLMPSFPSSPSPIVPYIGVKLVTYFPQNSSIHLPGVHGAYVLFSSSTGQTLASIDGTTLTLFRTASISGLASRFLSRTDSETLVMVGSGSLAPHLIRSHLAARPSLRRVIIWNRTLHKAQKLAQKMRENQDQEPELRDIEFQTLDLDLGEIVRLGDVISCATNSVEPLVRGRDLKAGAHLDLVGSFMPSMRECDEEAVRRGRVFVDCEAALEEAGELVGVFGSREIGGKLVELITGERVGRRDEEEVTVFKSVGSGVVDILAAQLVYETYVKKINCK